MATKTKNGMFTKPDYTDAADIGVINKITDGLEGLIYSPYGSAKYPYFYGSRDNSSDSSGTSFKADRVALMLNADITNDADDPSETMYTGGPALVRTLKDVATSDKLVVGGTNATTGNGYNATGTSIISELNHLHDEIDSLNSNYVSLLNDKNQYMTVTGFYSNNATDASTTNDVAKILSDYPRKNFVLYFNNSASFSRTYLGSTNAILVGNYYSSIIFGSDGNRWLFQQGTLSHLGGNISSRITNISYNDNKQAIQVTIDGTETRYVKVTAE